MSIEETRRRVRVTITKWRHDRELTLEQVEVLTGISQKTLSHYEDGSYLPTISSLYKICEGLGVSSSEILGF